MNLIILTFSPGSRISRLHRPKYQNIPIGTLFSNALKICCFLNVTDSKQQAKFNYFFIFPLYFFYWSQEEEKAPEMNDSNHFQYSVLT